MKTGHKKTRILIDYMLPLSLLFPLNKTEIRRESETYRYYHEGLCMCVCGDPSVRGSWGCRDDEAAKKIKM